MLQVLSAILGLLLAYLIPGLSISYAIFPYERRLPLLGRIALSVSLSSSLITSSLFLSNWLLGCFENSFIIGLQAILILASWMICRRQRTNRVSSTRNFPKAVDDERALPKPVLWLFSSATVFIILFRFYNALLFPITNWDSLTEYAYLGRLYFTEGRMPTISGATLGIGSSANYPPLVSLLYAWFYTMTGGVNEVLAKTVSPIFSLLTVIITHSLAKEMYNSRTLAISSLFFLATVPIFILVSEECLSDIVVTSTSLSAIYFLYLGLERREPVSNRFVFVGGLLAGVSAFTKYTGLASLVTGWALISVTNLRNSGHISMRTYVGKLTNCKSFIVFFLGFLVLGAPWYFRNLVVLGNPVYPLLYQIFGGKNIDPWLMKNGWDAHFSTIKTQNGLDFSPQNLLLTYFAIFFKVSPYETLDLGPFLGAFFAIGIVFSIKRREPPDIFLLIWAFSYLVMWRLGFGTFLRYLSIILPALAITSARGLVCIYDAIDSASRERIVHNSFPRVPSRVWLKIVIFLVLFQGFLLPSAINGIRGYKTWVFTSPLETREDYLKTRFQGTWDTVEFLNKTSPDAVILTYDHSLAYYVDRKFIFSDEPRVKRLHLAESDSEISNILTSLNISYIVVTTVYEEYFPLLRVSYFYTHLDDRSYARLVLDKFPSKVYAVGH